MNRKHAAAAALALCLLVPLPVCAAEEEPAEAELLQQVEDFDLLEALPEKTRRELEQLGLESPDPDTLKKLGPAEALDYVLDKAREQLGEPARAMARVLGAVVLMAFWEGVNTAAGRPGGAAPVFEAVAALAVAATVARPVISCVQSTASALCDCSDFMLSFLPVFTGLLAANGQTAAAATAQSFLFWACQMASWFASQLLVPLVGFFLALCLAGAAAPGLDLGGLAAAAKSAASWALGLMMTLFVGLLSLSSVVAAGSDSLGTRTARFLLGSFVPVVGGALSEAFATAQGCLRLIKASVGVYGVIAAAVLFLPLVLRLAAWRATLELSAAAAKIAGVGRLSGLLKSIGAAVGLLLALVLCFGLLLVVSVALLLLVGQGVN